MRAGIYVRVSTEDQMLHGYSLEAQRDRCTKYVREKEYELTKVYIDEGISAKSMNRPALQQMLEDVKAKKLDVIVVWNTDRLTRTTVDGLMMAQNVFLKNGVQYVSLTEDIDLTTPDGEMFFTIRLSIAQAERKRIGQRTKLGYAKRAQLGLRNTPSRPYGYEVGPNLSLTLNEEEKEIVLRIFNRYVQGTSPLKIARELNVDDIPGPRGGKWNHVGVRHILQNVTYIGYNTWQDRKSPGAQQIVVKADHEPIVPESLFQEVQRQMKRRAGGEMSKTSYDYYYSKILKCAACGRSFTGKMWRRGETKQKRYKCLGRIHFGDCKVPEIAEHKITKLLFEHFRVVVDQVDVSREVAATSEQKDLSKQRKTLSRDIEKSKAEYERLVDLFMRDKIDMDVYEKKRDQVKNRIAELEKQLAELPDVEPERKHKQTIADLIKFINQLEENWEYMNEQQRKMVIQRMYKAVTIRRVGKDWRLESYEPAF